MKTDKAIFITIVALIGSLIFAEAIKDGTTIKTITITKVITKQVPATDKQKVQTFVHELMTSRQANCLLWIFEKESNVRPSAKNKHSTARGIGQLLASTYANIGLKHSADPMAQVVASIAYISRHYGSDGACAAKAFWQKHRYW